MMDSYHQDKSAETPQPGHSHGDRERRKPAVEVKVEEENTDPLYPPPSPQRPTAFNSVAHLWKVAWMA